MARLNGPRSQKNKKYSRKQEIGVCVLCVCVCGGWGGGGGGGGYNKTIFRDTFCENARISLVVKSRTCSKNWNPKTIWRIFIEWLGVRFQAEKYKKTKTKKNTN